MSQRLLQHELADEDSSEAPLLVDLPEASEEMVDPHGGGPGFLKAGGLAAAVYTLSSISLGVGVFVLPSVFNDMGVIPALLSLLIFGVWSYFMQIELVLLATSLDPPVLSYEALVDRILGPVGTFLLCFFTAVAMLIGNAGHMKTVVVLLHDLLEFYVTDTYGIIDFDKRKEVLLYIGLLSIALLYCTGSRINGLRFVSTASVTLILITCLWCTGECMFWYWPKGQIELRGDNASPMASGDWRIYAANIPTFAFVFSGTFCLFPVYTELNERNLTTVRKAVGLSTLVCTCGYAVVALVALITFGRSVNVDPYRNVPAPNFLYVFPPTHYVVTFLCFCLVVVITLLYAIINFQFVKAIKTIIGLVLPASSFARLAAWPHLGLVITVVGMMMVVAINLVFDNLVTLFGLSGGWGCAFVVYFVPSLLSLKGSPSLSVGKRVALVASLLGVIAVVVPFTYTLF